MTAREEAYRILQVAGADHFAALQVIERQLAVLISRSHVLLFLSGMFVTVTGFSARATAQTSLTSRLSVCVGMFIVLAAAATAVVGLLRIKWVTQVAADQPLETLVNAITIRQRNARYLGAAQVLFVLGFGLYCAAIAQLLMNA